MSNPFQRGKIASCFFCSKAQYKHQGLTEPEGRGDVQGGRLFG